MSNIRTMSEALRFRLNARKRQWRQLCADNPGLSYSWLTKFSTGASGTDNAKIDTLEKLERALTKQDMIDGTAKIEG